MVSQNINPRSVEPDRGTAIQSIEARLNKYSYSYRKAGTYTATFVAKNANMWESKATVRKLTIVVQEHNNMDFTIMDILLVYKQ